MSESNATADSTGIPKLPDEKLERVWWDESGMPDWFARKCVERAHRSYLEDQSATQKDPE